LAHLEAIGASGKIGAADRGAANPALTLLRQHGFDKLEKVGLADDGKRGSGYEWHL